MLDALHTICDVNPETVQSFCTQYPGVNGAISFAEVLSMPEIQGIAISTPAPSHAILIREAFLAGKDVYVEKPLGITQKIKYP